MIALPVAAHNTTRKDSPGMMIGEEEWPSLGGQPTTTSATATAEGDDWELLTPAEDDNGAQGDSSTPGEEVVVVSNPRCFIRKNSVSAPDLRDLDEEENQSEASSSAVMVSGPPSVATGSTINPWGAKNRVSFKDVILAPSKHAPAHSKKSSVPKPQARIKVKSRYVVTPIKRCAKSTGDLLSLAEGDDEEVLGESDAMEYYNRKSHGEHGRNNGLKIRPDEAKRKEMIVMKKNMQRQAQK
jgi:hypothetical protein